MTRILEYGDRDALFAGLAAEVETGLHAALARQTQATLCVPGGTTPGPFFRLLRRADLDWARVRVMLGDERFVPETSDRSNSRLLKETLLQDRAAAAQWIPLYAAADQPEDVIADLCEGVAAALPIDVLILGMGADMHTASIFPGADKLAEALAEDAPPLMPMRAPGAPEPRITLTAPVLRAARTCHILIAGTDKREALDRAAQPGPWEAAPIRLALENTPPPTIHYAD